MHKKEPPILKMIVLPIVFIIKGHQLTESQRLTEQLIRKFRKQENLKKIMNASSSDSCTTVR